jgi:hypothetical protein
MDSKSHLAIFMNSIEFEKAKPKDYNLFPAELLCFSSDVRAGSWCVYSAASAAPGNFIVRFKGSG